MIDPVHPSRHLRGITLLFVLTMLPLAPGSARAANGDCGEPSSNGPNPNTTDALFVLKAAVGSKDCDLCICDVTDDAKITAADSLRTLKKAVGQDVTLTCPTCQPSLSGIVAVPPAAASLGAAAFAANTVSAGPGGLVPAAGATVELLSLDAEGLPQLPALATTTSKADGSYKFTPLPDPGSQTIVRATIGGSSAKLRAFVSGSSVDVDPISEFVVASTVNAVAADASAGLDSLTVAEINDLTLLVRATGIDFTSAATVEDAVALVDDRTGGVYSDFAADFATGDGPTTAIAGNFNLVNVGMLFARSFTPGSLGVPSVNERSIATGATAGPLVIAGDGAVSEPDNPGRAHALIETSGSTPQQSGPDIAINAAASLASSDINGSNSGSSVLLASDHGAAMVNDTGTVSPGIFAKGSRLGMIPAVFTSPSLSDGQARLALALRQGQGLSNSSLSAAYATVQFEVDLEASTDASNVHRAVSGRTTSGTLTFDGNGHLALSAFAGAQISLSKNGPLPNQPAAAPDVALSGSDANETAVSGLDYTLSPTGALTVKAGSNVVAVGAVTSDTNVVVLQFGDESDTSAGTGYLIAIKPGSGMNNTSGQGTYRSIDLRVELQHDAQPGSPDVAPDVDFRSAGLAASVGSFDLDGAGHVAVHRSIGLQDSLGESSSVQRHSAGPSDVFDADVSIRTSTAPDGSGTQTHTYAVSSKGVVTVDAANNGGIHGYLSPDGNVFVLPESSTDSSQNMETGILVGLREP